MAHAVHFIFNCTIVCSTFCTHSLTVLCSRCMCVQTLLSGVEQGVLVKWVWRTIFW